MKVDAERLGALFGPASVTTLRETTSLLARALDPETPVVMPESLELLQEAIRFAAGESLRVLPAGAMEHSIHSGLPDAVDLVLSTRRMQSLLDYEPGDLTLVAQAGLPLHAIEQRTGDAGQRLAAAPWPGVAGTIGGAVAANRCGPGRLGTGTLRDALLGCRVVHADGTTTRSGGRVVKNVTGFDLPKLYVGSQGTLVILTELNLRLAPRPEASALVRAHVPAHDSREMLLQLHRQRSGAMALVAFQGSGIPELPPRENHVHLLARFEGREPVVRQQARACAEAWEGDVLSETAAQAAWTSLRRHEEPEAGRLVLRVSSLPVAGLEVLENLAPSTSGGGSAAALFGVGTCSVRLPEAAALGDAVALQAALEAMGCSVRWLHTAGKQRATLQGTEPSSRALHEATKTLYDASRVFPEPSWRAERMSR